MGEIQFARRKLNFWEWLKWRISTSNRIPKFIRILYWDCHRAISFLKEKFAEHCPVKIPRRKPAAPLCEELNFFEDDDGTPCGKQMHISAVNTGDGWLFFWECEEHPGESENYIEGWWPFMFGVWCNTDDLTRIGIEVV